ncbi:MAG: acyltransferase family protein [Aestuariivirga sp.]
MMQPAAIILRSVNFFVLIGSRLRDIGTALVYRPSTGLPGSVQAIPNHGYRPDIDGLRAIAVLLVVLFHAQAGVPGGFIGVDIFFVISGFLITSLIESDLKRGNFSITSFYERRIRRIFPALFVMILASFVGAWILYMPPELVLFGKSAVAASLFVSNMLFWKEAGYFDTVAEFKPLLHTWSLSVEEQFYVFYPLLLFAMNRLTRVGRLSFLSIVVAASFLLSVYWVGKQPVSAFYLLPSRFWELGVGGLLAIYSGRYVGNLFLFSFTAAAGLVLIGIAAFILDSQAAFPGMAALLPCIGTVLIIFAGHRENPIRTALAWRPLVSIGLVSYPLYLWHWPVLLFAQYRLGRALNGTEVVVMLLVSLAAAGLSWRYVERPFRQRKLLPTARPLFAAALIVVFIPSFGGLMLVAAKGFPDRLPTEVLAIYNVRSDRSPLGSQRCFTDNNGRGPTDDDVRAGKLCTFGTEDDAPVSVLVWGDSHAAAMAPAVEAAAQRGAVKGALVGMGSCPPLIDYQSTNPIKVKREACIARNAAVMELIRNKRIPLVVLVARWPREMLDSEYGNEGPFFDPSATFRTGDRSSIVAGAFERTLLALSEAGSRVVLVHDVPEPGYDVPVALARSVLRGEALDVNPRRDSVEARRLLALKFLTPIAMEHGAEIVDPVASLCDQTHCYAEVKQIPQYVDSDHLTLSASRSLSHLFDAVISDIAPVHPDSVKKN